MKKPISIAQGSPQGDFDALKQYSKKIQNKTKQNKSEYRKQLTINSTIVSLKLIPESYRILQCDNCGLRTWKSRQMQLQAKLPRDQKRGNRKMELNRKSNN